MATQSTLADSARDYLLKDGNLRVPGGRYGHDTRNCAEVAIVVSTILAKETGEGYWLDESNLDYAMGLVVNSHDDVRDLIRDYGPEHGFNPADYLDNVHDWNRARFTGAMTCSQCGLLPLDSEDYRTDCEVN